MKALLLMAISVVVFNFTGVLKTEANVQYVSNDNYKLSYQTSSDGVPFLLGLNLGMTIKLDDGYSTNHRMIGWLEDYCMLPYSATFSMGDILYNAADGSSKFTPNNYLSYVAPSCSLPDSAQENLMYNVKYANSATGDAIFISNSFIPGFDSIKVTISPLPYNTSFTFKEKESGLDYSIYYSRLTPAFEEFGYEINRLKNNVKSDHEKIEINNQTYSITEFYQFRAYKDLFKKLRGEDPYTEVEIEKDFIEGKILFNLATKKGLNVDKVEAKEYMHNVFNNMSKSNSENAKYVRELQDKYQKSLNLTDQEYESLLVTKYQELLTIGKLKKNFFKEYEVQEFKGADIDEKWKNYKDHLVKKASVEGF